MVLGPPCETSLRRGPANRAQCLIEGCETVVQPFLNRGFQNCNNQVNLRCCVCKGVQKNQDGWDVY